MVGRRTAEAMVASLPAARGVPESASIMLASPCPNSPPLRALTQNAGSPMLPLHAPYRRQKLSSALVFLLPQSIGQRFERTKTAA